MAGGIVVGVRVRWCAILGCRKGVWGIGGRAPLRGWGEGVQEGVDSASIQYARVPPPTESVPVVSQPATLHIDM